MKVHLANIPEEGLRLELRFALASFARLTEAVGEQRGELWAQLWLKNQEGNVQIIGEVRASLTPPCQRCLDPVALEIEEPLLVALIPLRDYDDAPEDAHLGAGELEVSYYSGEELDLSVILEDELLLLLPDAVAGEDEDGRCVACGNPVDELYTTGEPRPEDHPFAQMRRYLSEE